MRLANAQAAGSVSGPADGTGTVFLRMWGLTLALESQLGSFAHYVRAAMSYFLCDPVESPDFRSKLEWVDGPPAASVDQAFPNAQWQQRPDRDLYLGNASAYWLRIDDFRDLHLSFALEKSSLTLCARYYFRIGNQGRLEALRRLRYRGPALEALRARSFSTLLYYLVYHPLLWHLSRKRNWHLLHGAAVASSQGALLLSGMPGCGKSTLSVALLADPRLRMLSDNLVLHDGRHVMACPELLLLDPASMKSVGKGAERLEAVGERRVFGRDAYRPDVWETQPVELLGVVDV